MLHLEWFGTGYSIGSLSDFTPTRRIFDRISPRMARFMEQLSGGLFAVKVGNWLPDQRAHEMEMLVSETVMAIKMGPFGEEWRGLNGDPRAVSDQGETCRGEMV